MAGHRCLTVLASAAALLLIALGGTAWAEPGHGNAYGHGNGHANGHGHSRGHHHAHTSDAGTSSGGDELDAAVRLPRETTDSNGPVTARHHHGLQRGHDHWSRRELADHPGKALGLFKHDDADVRRHDPVQRPRHPAVPAPRNQSTPKQQHDGGMPAPPVNPPDSHPTDQPGSQPPLTKPPVPGREQSLSRLLPRAAELRFTALPLLIMVGLTMCIGGLIRLARHRA